MPSRKRSVLVMSDQVLFRQSLAATLKSEGYQVTDQATTAPLRTKRPDAVLVDLSNAVTDALQLVDDLHDELIDSFIVLIGSATRLAAAQTERTASSDHQPDAQLELPRADLAALKNVINGRVPSLSNELARAHKQWAQVTARQRDVLRWLAHGLDNPGIASKMRVGIRAIKAHISALLALFGLDSRTQLALLACEGGLRPL